MQAEVERLQQRLQDFESLKDKYERKLAKKDRQIKALKNALSSFASSGSSEDDLPSGEGKNIKEEVDGETLNDDASEISHQDNASRCDIDEGDSDPEEIPEAFYDAKDGVYRCSDCAWEVAGGFCHGCGEARVIPDSEYESLANEGRSIMTDDEPVRSDCRLAPRRERTPLLEVSPNVPVPEEYFPAGSRAWVYTTGSSVSSDRSDEYRALLARGATPLMCETFHLEFLEEDGIIAWADTSLYETYAGPKMQVGDFWKIYLGRRIELDHDDLDGSEFVENLLEEVLLFSSPIALRNDVADSRRWETIEETPGIWATKPVLREEPPEREQHSRLSDEDSDEDRYLSDHESDHSWSRTYERTEGMDDDINTGPVIQHEEYDTRDDETDVDDQDVPLPSFEPNVPDADWETHENFQENEISGVVPEGAVVEDHGLDVDETMDGIEYYESDSADSDFDSEECLSGDEDVASTLRKRRVEAERARNQEQVKQEYWGM